MAQSAEPSRSILCCMQISIQCISMEQVGRLSTSQRCVIFQKLLSYIFVVEVSPMVIWQSPMHIVMPISRLVLGQQNLPAA